MHAPCDLVCGNIGWQPNSLPNRQLECCAALRTAATPFNTRQWLPLMDLLLKDSVVKK